MSHQGAQGIQELAVTLASVKRTANLVLQFLENLSYRYVLTIAAAAPNPPPPLL